MENKINLVEILKDCPKGMELDSPLLDNAEFKELYLNFHNYPIVIRNSKTNAEIYLTKYGQFVNEKGYKCIIFPKGKTTWEGFQRPFKNGDIVITTLGSTAIIKEPVCNSEYYAHCVWVCDKLITDDTIGAIRLATESEKAELFNAIKENGYKWNEESKSLEKLAEPKFKVGDRVRNKYYKDYIYDIHDITDKGYRAKEIDADSPIIILFGSQEDNYVLVPDKFDISTLKPYDKVLVRTKTFTSFWTIDFYDGYRPNVGGCFTPFGVSGGKYFQQCIPYEGNEYLLGTANDCNEFYKNWK